MDVAVVGIDHNDGQQIFFGEKKTGGFFQTRPKILEDMFAYHSFGRYFYKWVGGVGWGGMGGER